MAMALPDFGRQALESRNGSKLDEFWAVGFRMVGQPQRVAFPANE